MLLGVLLTAVCSKSNGSEAERVAIALLGRLGRNDSDANCGCGYGRCFDAASGSIWIGAEFAARAIPAVAPFVASVLDPVLDLYAHEREPAGCSGTTCLNFALDNPESLYWQHDLGVLALGTIALGLRNHSVSDRWAWISVGEMFQDSYPSSAYTHTYAQNAILLGDGTLAKNTSGAWLTKGCTSKPASPTCQIVWAEDAVLGSAVASLFAFKFGRDTGLIGRDAANKAAAILLNADAHLQLPSGAFSHGANANFGNKSHSCCSPAIANGAVALAHVAAITAIRSSFPSHPSLPKLQASLVLFAAAAAAAQRTDGTWPALLPAAAAEGPEKEVEVGSEVAGSAYIVAALAAGSATGLLDGSKYAALAKRGFATLASAVGTDGHFGGVVPSESNVLLLGTLRSTAADYMNTARPLGSKEADTAIGALLLAAAAVASLDRPPTPGPTPPAPSPHCHAVKQKDNCGKFPKCAWCEVGGVRGCFARSLCI